MDTARKPSRNVSLDALMIERAGHQHVPYLRRLKEQVMEERYRPATDEQGFESWRSIYCTDEYFDSLIDDENALLLCVGSLSDPVGMVVLHKREGHLEIDDLLCLHPGRGDGTRLLRSCLQYAEAWRIGKVVIDIYPGHTGAERFLERHGFTLEGDSSNDLGRPMHRFVRHIEPAK